MQRTVIEIHNTHPQTTIHSNAVKKVVHQVMKEEKFHPKMLSIVFVDDEYLRRLHREYLKEDSYTDVMAFDLSDEKGQEGEIYISVDRARFYAQKLDVPLNEELVRLIIHGMLHLKGYDDATEAQRQQMRQRENYHIHQLQPLPAIAE